jgi:hypothetical protein
VFKLAIRHTLELTSVVRNKLTTTDADSSRNSLCCCAMISGDHLHRYSCSRTHGNRSMYIGTRRISHRHQSQKCHVGKVFFAKRYIRRRAQTLRACEHTIALCAVRMFVSTNVVHRQRLNIAGGIELRGAMSKHTLNGSLEVNDLLIPLRTQRSHELTFTEERNHVKLRHRLI